jgi:hypothetical protein
MILLRFKLSILIISVALNCFAQKVYENSSTPKDKNLNFVLKEKVVCDFNSCEDSFVSFSIKDQTQIDKDSSFFFLDSKNSKMVKFDKNGQFIRSFSNPGNGPGEFPNFFVIRFYVTNDSLYLVNHCEGKILVFDTDGKFSCNRQFSNESQPGGANMITNNNKVLIYDTFWGMYGKQKRKLVLADLNMKPFKEIYNLDTEDTPAEMMSGKNAFEIACSKDEIYMSVPGDYGRYLINVYDFKGNLKYKIKKNYSKVKIDNEKLKKTMKKNGISSKGLTDYQTPVQYMFCDLKGRLFVRSSKDDDKENCRYFDIFQKGEFINRIAFEVPDNIDWIVFKNDFAYGADCGNNSITVYQYEEVKK